jgi:hypothetical protein
VSVRSNAWVCGRSLAVTAGSNPAGGTDVSVVYRQIEIPALGWSLVQRSPTCGVSECDREASIMRRPWSTRSCCTMKKKLSRLSLYECWKSASMYGNSYVTLHYSRGLWIALLWNYLRFYTTGNFIMYKSVEATKKKFYHRRSASTRLLVNINQSCDGNLLHVNLIMEYKRDKSR